MGRVAIHRNPQVAWQDMRAGQMLAGMKVLGIDAYLTSNRHRETSFAVVLGTTFWRQVERSGRYLLVDRASWGDPDYVSLVWDGHGRRGDHKVPQDASGRWDVHGCKVKDWKLPPGKKRVLCGQTETYSPHYASPEDFYRAAQGATYFRPHPAGDNPTGLPECLSWAGVGQVITLNSSVAVESVLRGIPTVTMDEGSMAWDVTGHEPESVVTPDRTDWLEWLAWTQWHWDEIAAGAPVRHMFEEL